MVYRQVGHPWLHTPSPWVQAIIEIDEHQNQKPTASEKREDKEKYKAKLKEYKAKLVALKMKLVALLKSDKPLPANARRHLADLLERYELDRPRGRSRTPSYALSHTVAQLDVARDEVKADMKLGMLQDESITKRAKYRGVEKEALEWHLEGKHASANRIKKRFSPS